MFSLGQFTFVILIGVTMNQMRVFMFRTSPLIHSQMCSQNFILISKETHEWLNIDLRTLWHPLCVFIQLISMWTEQKGTVIILWLKVTMKIGTSVTLLPYVTSDGQLGSITWWPETGQREINTLILDVSDLSVMGRESAKTDISLRIASSINLVCPVWV